MLLQFPESRFVLTTKLLDVTLMHRSKFRTDSIDFLLKPLFHFLLNPCSLMAYLLSSSDVGLSDRILILDLQGLAMV